jgi:hypothetical protein
MLFAKVIQGETYFLVPENLSPIDLTLVLTKSTVLFVILLFSSQRARGFGAIAALHIQDLKSKPNKKSANEVGSCDQLVSYFW